MNSGQLKKINELVNELERLNKIMEEGEHTVKVSLSECGEMVAYEDFDIWEKVEPVFIAYRDKLKAELKELGYEE